MQRDEVGGPIDALAWTPPSKIASRTNDPDLALENLLALLLCTYAPRCRTLSASKLANSAAADSPRVTRGTVMESFRRPLNALLLKFTARTPSDYVVPPLNHHRPVHHRLLYKPIEARLPFPPTSPPDPLPPMLPLQRRPRFPSAPSPLSLPDNNDASMRDASPLVLFDDDPFSRTSPNFDSDHMIFGPLDIDDVHCRNNNNNSSSLYSWDAMSGFQSPATAPSFSASPASPCSQLEFDPSFSPGAFAGFADMPSALSEYDDPSRYISNWLVDDDFASLASTSAPITIPSMSIEGNAQVASSFVSYQDSPMYLAKAEAFSPPMDHPALHPLSRSMDGALSDPPVMSIAPPQISQPSWASQLWNTGAASRPVASPPPSLLHPPHPPLFEDAYATQRQRSRRSPNPLAHVFQSSSAPSGIQSRAPSLARTYSRRAESAHLNNNPNATVQWTSCPSHLTTIDHGQSTCVSARPSSAWINGLTFNSNPTAPQKSHLKPPKLAPSTWQL